MSTIQITAPDGKTIEVNAPDGATSDQIHQAAMAAASHYQSQAGQQQPELTPLEQVKQRIGNASGLIGKTSAILDAPEQLSRSGLNMMASAIPQSIGGPMTGNLPLDVLKGTPRVAADTIAQVAPGFVSKAAILTAGAAKLAQGAAPLAKVALKGLGAQGESLSGAVPGSLNAAYNDAKLMFSPGKSAAGPLYEAAKAELPQGASLFKGMYEPKEIVDAAKTYLDKGGQLEPAEALAARKAVDVLLKSKRVVKDELFALRTTFDNIAKGSDNIAKADPAYVRGMMADSLRNIFPQNKYGGASAFKVGIMTALKAMGTTGKAASVLLSPAVQGGAATTAGVLGRNVIGPAVSNPGASALIAALLSQRKKGNQ